GKVLAGGVADASGALGALPDSPAQPPGAGGANGNGNGNGRTRPPVGSGGRGPGGGFDVSPPTPSRDDDAPMPNLDEIRQQPSHVPEADAGGELRASLPPSCGDCYEAPGEDPEFSVSRSLPANETGEPAVDLGSRNFNWSLPLVSLPGRSGLDLNLTLYYNSLVWTKQGTTVQFNSDDGFPGPGFRLGLPAIQKRFRDAQHLYAYMMVTPSGGRVKLRQTHATSTVYESLDGTYVRLQDLGAGGALVRTADGTLYTFANTSNGEKRCTEVKDRNGNFITITYNAAGRVATVRDTLNRVVNFNYDAEGNLASLTQARSAHGLVDTLAEFVPGSVFVQPSFAGLTVLGPNGTNASVLREVRLPDGSRHVFDYTPFGQVYKITRLAADGHARAYEGYNVAGSPWAAMSAQSDCQRFTERRDWAEWNVRWQSTELVTRYSVDSTGGERWTEVTLPDGRTKLKEYFFTDGWRKGLTERTEVVFDGVVRKWTTLQWTQDDEALEYQRNPRVTQTEVGDPEGNVRRTVVAYFTQSGVSLPSEVQEYAAAGGALALARRTTTEYRWDAAYTDRRIFGLPSLVQTYDGAGALVSKLSYGYDWDANGDHFRDTPAPAAQHDRNAFGPSFIYGRGNLSVVARYDVTDPSNAQDTWQETKWRHNSAGSVLLQRDHLWHAVHFDYADSFSDNANRDTFAYPTRVTDEDGYHSTAKYNYATGAVVQSSRPSSGTNAAANVTYETVVTAFDSVGRVERVTSQNNGAYTRFAYPASHAYVQTYTTLVAGRPEAYTFTHFDGAGRVFTRAGDHPGSATNYRASWVKYDEMGRAVEHSNPTEINSAGVPSGDDAGSPVVWTLQAYDWQGRPTLTTNPDGSTTELTYGGCGCAGGETVTARDERGRRRRLYTDGLGRLSKVEELNWNQSVYSSAAYAYNARDQLTQVSHAGQSRTFEYDGHGRLRRRTTPEQGATVYA
ncbi:MAG TPA: RHS repeat domain-containing protein, partial [Pyrinomonadaceae bacterium]|nr:RHS repeat domain-containing protein [Pyrinomonadaceae bacterium]